MSKPYGSTLAFTAQRNTELMRAYRTIIACHSHIVADDVAEMLVSTPCSRFWVSEERAYLVIKEMMRDRRILHTMHRTKRLMFEEIYRRVEDTIRQHPDRSLRDAVDKAVNSPAPAFYMRPDSAMQIIYRLKKTYRHLDRLTT